MDTVETLCSYKIDMIVVRDKHAGVPRKIADVSGVHVIDAGDGKHQHPTQALLDLYTIWQTKGHLDGLKVGVVGDILVKYMPLANNHVVDLLDREGAEAVVPDLLDFFAATIYEQDFKHTHLGKGWTASASAKLGIPALQRMRRPAIEALKASKRFDPPMAINHVAELAKPFLSIGNQYGEGWFLAGEMAELITSGTPNIVCIQPFACLPNHVVGKGVIKALRAAYPGANIVAVDYDPGASEVNQLNRIKLMLTAAQRALHAQVATPKKPQPPEAPSISLPHPKVAML